MDMFLQKPSLANVIDPSIEAEVKMAILLVHHNTFFNLSNHLTRYITKEFKGSSAAENFACGRTKTAAIVNCVGKHLKQELVQHMQENPFSVMLDASNDTRLYKMFPVTVHMYDVKFTRTMTKFLDMNKLVGREASTAQFEFNSIDKLFQTFELSQNLVTGLGVDNTNSNTGTHNSIKQKALLKNPNTLYLVVHVIFYSRKFSEIAKFDIKDH